MLLHQKKEPSLNASSSLGVGNKLPPLFFVTQVGFCLLVLAWFFYHSLVFVSLFVSSFFPPLLNLFFHNPMNFSFHKHICSVILSICSSYSFGQKILSVFWFFLQYFLIKDLLTALTQNRCRNTCIFSPKHFHPTCHPNSYSQSSSTIFFESLSLFLYTDKCHFS